MAKIDPQDTLLGNRFLCRGGSALLVEDVPDAIARDPRVRQLYLGEAGHG